MNVNVLLRSSVKTCGMLFFMLRLSWQLTLLTCIEMPLLAFIQNSYNNISQVSKPSRVGFTQLCFGFFFFSKPKTQLGVDHNEFKMPHLSDQKTAQEIQDCNAETAELASSVIGSIKTVRSFKAERQEQQRYEQTLNRKLQVLRRKGIYSAFHLLIRRVNHRQSWVACTGHQNIVSLIILSFLFSSLQLAWRWQCCSKAEISSPLDSLAAAVSLRLCYIRRTWWPTWRWD